MKQKKHWVVFAGIGMASVLVCALLVISSAFTSGAMAAGGQADPLIETPDIGLASSPPKSVTKITSDTPDPSSPGQTVTVSVTVSGGGATPTGTVDITGSDSNCTITLSGGSGSCGVVFNTKGSKTLKAYYSGDPTYNPSKTTAAHKVVRAVTSTTITSDTPDPSDPGTSVVVGVTVNTAGVNTPTGRVDITGANSNCSIYLSGGSGSCSVVFNSAGIKTLKAAYKGDVYNAKSSGSESHTVNKGSTTTLITADNPDPSVPGQAVKVKFTVTGGAASPTGTVVITGADINCSATLSGGMGSCKVVFLTIGDKTLTATYNGNKNYLSSTTTAAHSVRNATTTIITADNFDPSLPGEAIEVDVTVSGAGGPPTGTVDITGANVNCTITLSGGSGSCGTVQFNTGGTKIITATYNGDADYVGSVGTTTHTVRRGSTATAVTSDTPDPSHVYGLVSVTVTVAPAAPGVVTPTGYVGISTDGGSSVCTVTLVGGTGSCNLFFNTVGYFTIWANYGGDGTYLPSSVTEPHTVN